LQLAPGQRGAHNEELDRPVNRCLKARRYAAAQCRHNRVQSGRASRTDGGQRQHVGIALHRDTDAGRSKACQGVNHVDNPVNDDDVCRHGLAQ